RLAFAREVVGDAGTHDPAADDDDIAVAWEICVCHDGNATHGAARGLLKPIGSASSSGRKKGRATMTFPDRRLERPLEPPDARSENTQAVIPPHQRNQDPERSTHDLVTESSRPLTEEERKAADRDASVAHTVYAPASERVAREPVPGHRDF